MKDLKGLWEDIFTVEVCKGVLVNSLNSLVDLHGDMSHEKVTLDTDLQDLDKIVKDLVTRESNLVYDCGFVNFHIYKTNLEYFKNYLKCFGVDYEDSVSYEYYGSIILNWGTEDLPDNKYGKLLTRLSRVQSVAYKNTVYKELLPYINRTLSSDNLISVNTIMD